MFRNILAVVLGIVVGSVVNMALINLGHVVIALPPGADVSTFDAVKASMQMFGPEQFIFPFIAHAGGTLVGAFVSALIAATHKFKIAMAVGVFYLIAGVIVAALLPAPLWYDAIDILFAYIPMAWIGAKLAGAGKR